MARHVILYVRIIKMSFISMLYQFTAGFQFIVLFFYRMQERLLLIQIFFRLVECVKM